MAEPNSGSLADDLARIEAKLDRLDARLAPLAPVLDAAPAAVAVAGDTFDEYARAVGDLDDRLRAGLALIERLTEPATLRRMQALLDLVESAPDAVAMLADSFDETARAMADQGIDLAEIVPSLTAALTMHLKLAQDPRVRSLVESPELFDAALGSLTSATRAVANASRAPARPLGPLALLSALRDPDVQVALGFAVDVARRFGATPDEVSRSPMHLNASTP